MKKIFTIIAIAIATHSFSQVSITPAPATTEDKVLNTAEVMPMYPGGFQAFGDYVQKNMIYKKADGAPNPSNPCMINFVVEKDGSISNVNVLRSSQNDLAFDKECLRLISNMPKWTPGKDKGQPVRVSMNLPIKYSDKK